MFDKYGREITYLRMSVTDLCNLRCRYCMPADNNCVAGDVCCRESDAKGASKAGMSKQPHPEMLTEDEMICAVRAAASLGISKLRITGGEPLVKKNIVSICERAAGVEGIDEICVTTNGIMLPGLAGELVSAGVSRVNISLDTLNPDKYRDITRGGSLDDALKGLHAALSAGFERVKINSVLINGFNTDEIEALAELTMKYPVDVRFIELMPMVADSFGPEAYISGDEVLRRLPDLEKIDDDGVAKMYRLPGAMGGVGLISPISAHFCAECTRLRLTADGRLKPCLHSPDEYPIKGLDEAGMRARMEEAILAKPGMRPELSFDSLSKAGRSMNRIGG